MFTYGTNDKGNKASVTGEAQGPVSEQYNGRGQ